MKLLQSLTKSSANLVKKGTILGLTVILAATIAGCSSSSGSTATINLATKGFAESDILTNALKLLIENDTKLKTNIVTVDRSILWEALKKKEVDAYVDYTGTALINILKQAPEFDPQKVYDIVKDEMEKQHQVAVLDPIGFNNTYAFGLRTDVAEKYGIKTTSELADHAGDLIFGTSDEFLNRPDAWPRVEETYKLKFKDISIMQNPGLMLQAMEQKLIDTMIVLTTTSHIAVKPITVLEDDKNVFLPYYAVPLVRDEVLKDHPELKAAINKLAGKITDSEMQKLNGQVELEKRPALEVAKEWLQAQGLIQK
ncbi:glycine betaine ABC transporter substrate-binding protein [Paenibacillus sp. GCM10012307]|uniref:Glycine/betaine ABC transporter substrate-binding protein n=1 Tax=Paenibacillus roseus TaxID=2798579 RepID=A0A934J1L9_9BACL|nr:glycine betaine ABC transporter substrate-binding protein [Paenibacillus roseus]MBJ6359914.1 glycine/betaine ABC transporter substrate-binding protein [Paenibacillus roseus]